MRWIGSLLLAIIGTTAAGRALAQTAPQFQVASVKVAAQQDILESRPRRSTGRFRWTTQMVHLLAYAYGLEWWRISGDTSKGAIYEIEATHDPKVTDDELRLMVRSLLTDRFQLKVHWVTKEVNGYALTVANGGPKMLEATGTEMPGLPEWLRGRSVDPSAMEELVVATHEGKGVGAITGRRATMLQLSETLQRMLSTEVLDQTGLSGKYYFAFRYGTDADPDVPYPGLTGAIRDLGLRLEKRKGPVEMLVVDHMETVPVGN
jgi:uncharacterized protein (TIGR03435 family)